MRHFSKKRFVSRLSRSPLAYIALVVLSFLFAWKAIGAYEKTRIARKKFLETQNELTALHVQKERLAADLQNANTQFGQEKALREKFNVVREGEKVIMIVKPDQKATVADTLEKDTSFLGFLKKIFGKRE